MTTVKQRGFKHNRHKNDLIYCLLQPVYIILPIRLLAGGVICFLAESGMAGVT